MPAAASRKRLRVSFSAHTFTIFALGDRSYAKFCEAGKVFDKRFEECGAKRVTVRTRPDGFEVVDDGPGIADNARARIFEPFFTTKSAQGGTGLGLAVSYGIVQDHGGTLTVESSPSGTTFRVGFP